MLYPYNYDNRTLDVCIYREDEAFQWMARLREATAGDGVTFSERMDTPRRGRVQVSLRLNGEIRSLDRFLADPHHAVTVQGTIQVTGITRDQPIEGTLSLCRDSRSEVMRYDLRFVADDGSPWQAIGAKHIVGSGPIAAFLGLTTLRVECVPEEGGSGVQRTVLTMGALGVVRLGLSLRGVGFTRARRVRALSRFCCSSPPVL